MSTKKLLKKLIIVLTTSFNHFLAILLIGFIGGAMYPFLLGWLKPLSVNTPDAVSIANTYIVFTTIIFVGITVILGIAGYIFTQKLSESQASQENRIVENLIKDVQKNETLGIRLVQTILENGDVQRFFNDQIRSKIEESLKEIQADTNGNIQKNIQRSDAVNKMSNKISKNGGTSD